MRYIRLIFLSFLLISPAYSQSIVGKDWVCAAEHAEFPERTYFLSVVFQNQIWVLGGQDTGYQDLKDVWCSVDGKKWIQKTDKLPFGISWMSTAVVFNDKIWIVTQKRISHGDPYEIWFSSDGTNWEKSKFDTPPASIGYCTTSYSALAYKNNMWLIGGRTQPYLKDDVWCSSDGLHWDRVSHRKVMKDGPAIVFNDKMYVFSGFSPQSHLVWSSEDGINWKQTEESNFPLHRNGCGVVDYEGKIWVIAGEYCHGTHWRDVWNSSDGIHWIRVLDKAPFAKRENTRSVVFDGKIWVIGGDNILGPRNDVWHSP